MMRFVRRNIDGKFLRESKVLYDNLYPSRIIVGIDMDAKRLGAEANTFEERLQKGAGYAVDHQWCVSGRCGG